MTISLPILVLPSGELLKLFIKPQSSPLKPMGGHRGQKVKFVLLGKESIAPTFDPEYR